MGKTFNSRWFLSSDSIVPNFYCPDLCFFLRKSNCKGHRICFTAVGGNLMWVIYLSLAKLNTLATALAIGSDRLSSYKARELLKVKAGLETSFTFGSNSPF